MSRKFFSIDPNLQSALETVLEATQAAFPQLAPNQIAITWIPYEPPYRVNTGGAITSEEFWKYQPSGASYRGVELIEPASIVSLFYLVAAHDWLEQGMIQTSLETERAIADSIVASSNDALSYIVDILSGTTSGPSIPAGPFETWKFQRNIINRYFSQLEWPELRAVNMNQKLWHDGPYGREQDFLGKTLEHRNLLTTEATARLLHSIVGGVSVSARRSQKMMALLARSTELANGRSLTRFIGTGIASPAEIWSQASATSRVRHDAAYIESTSTHPYLLVVFTEGQDHAENEEIIPFVSKHIFEAAQHLLKS